MHIFFSGIGGTGIGPLALVAQQAGYTVSGSDKQDSLYVHYLRDHGITDIHIGQTEESIAVVHANHPIDWYVYSSAVAIEQPDGPEFRFCRSQGIRMTKRDALLNEILVQKQLKLIAIAGTHGKTTTTAMTIWALQQLHKPIGYILPAKSRFADMGAYEDTAHYFVYECDEFDRNFLYFHPEYSFITGIGWDHPDIYPTREEYNQAFRDFIVQSDRCIMWRSDQERLGNVTEHSTILSDDDKRIAAIPLAGEVNRRDAWLVACGLSHALNIPIEQILPLLTRFPGVARRFEKLLPGLYSDYAHTPEKIRGAIQLGHEVAGNNLVVVYEGLHNTRQHFIRNDLRNLFDDVKQLYIVPSYLAREDTSLSLLNPTDLRALLSETAQMHCTPAALNNDLQATIQSHLDSGDTVLCLTAGGGHSLDEWLRQEFIA